jgi:hypothetical protein
MSANATTQSLTRQPDKPPSPTSLITNGAVGMLVTVESISTQMQQLATVANVISPFSRPSHLAAGFAVSITAVQIDPTVDSNGNGATCYRGSFMKSDERALNRVGLRLISNALGIDWLPHPYCKRIDPGTIPHYAEYTVEGVYRTFDGSVQKVRGTAAVDFRDGSEQIGGWTPAGWEKVKHIDRANIGGWSEKRVKQARQKVLERAETMAQNRAIRDIGLRQVFTVADLAKPFICFRMSFVPDMNDPEIKRLVTLNNLQGLAAMWPQAAPQHALPAAPQPMDDAGDHDDHEAAPPMATPAPATSTTNTPPVSTPAPQATTAPPVESSGRRARQIAKVGQTKDGPFVILDGGEYFRVEADIAAASTAAQQAGRAVEVDIEVRQNEAWIIEMVYAGAAVEAFPPADAETIVSIETKTGTNARGPWTRYRLTTSTGKILTTFKSALAAEASAARDGHLPIRYAAHENEQYPGQLDLDSLRIFDGTEPDLPFEGQ